VEAKNELAGCSPVTMLASTNLTSRIGMCRIYSPR
jgi:hypothetical protein